METTFTAIIAAQDNSDKLLIAVPKTASDQLPSRGFVMVQGSVNGVRFRAPLEPDGTASHWFLMSPKSGLQVGDEATFSVTPTNDWPEPETPPELDAALQADDEALARWQSITTKARWDWLRWMNSVVKAETRQARPAKLISMLKGGKNRPCCFNRAMRTSPKLAELL